MTFRDRMLTCDECGRTFVYTVTEQRRLAEQLGTDEFDPPALCPNCSAGRQPQPAPSEMVPSAVREPHVKEKEPAVAPAVAAAAPELAPVAENALPEEAEFPLREEGIEVKLIGTVKWFSRKKGYGFITKADGKDLFFHRADIARGEHSLPQDGQQVEFQIRYTDKGPEAFNVSLLPTD